MIVIYIPIHLIPIFPSIDPSIQHQLNYWQRRDSIPSPWLGPFGHCWRIPDGQTAADACAGEKRRNVSLVACHESAGAVLVPHQKQVQA